MKEPHRWKKGERSPNPNGRPSKPEAEILRQALEAAKKKNGGKHLIEHAVEQAYKSENLCIAIMKKILPDKSVTEIQGNRIIVTFEEKPKDAA